MRQALLTLFGFMLPSLASAQAPVRIVGRVSDAVTQAPVAGAELTVGDLRAVSGSDGRFRIGNVEPGRVELVVRRIGYLPWRRALDLIPGLDRTADVALVPVPLELDSVVATSAPNAVAISGADLVRRGSDLGRALDGWQGLAVRRTGSGGPAAPQLRGAGPDEVLVLVDGLPINDPLTGRADLSRIPSREVDQVTLVPGAQSVRTGRRALGGVIVVDTRTHVPVEASGWASSYGGRGVRAGGSLGRLTVSGSTERYASRFPYSVPEVRGGGEARRGNAGGEQYSAALRYQGGDAVEVSLRGSMSDRGLPGTTTNPTLSAAAQDRSMLLGARHKDGKVEWSGLFHWLETRATDSSPPTGAPYDAYTHGVSGALSAAIHRPVAGAGWTGELGARGEVREDRFGGEGVRAGSSFTHAAIVLEALLHRGVRDVLTLAPVARLEGWTGSGSPRLTARLDAGWQRGATSVTAALGSAVTPPVLGDLFFREGVGVRLNPDLRPERVRWEVELGVRRDLAGSGTVGLRLFYGRIADLIVWAPDFRFIWSPQNVDVRRAGGEVFFGLQPRSGLRLDGSASYSAVTYDIPAGAQVQYRPRVTIDASALWTAGAWTADLHWHLIGRRYPNSAGTNPRPAFSLLDLGLERRLVRVVGIRCDVHDVTDTRPEFIAGYPTPGRSFTLTLNFVLP